MQLSPGDRIFIYSDGVPEAMSEQLEQFGEERFSQLLVKSKSQSIEESLDFIVHEIEKWCGTRGPTDDVSIVGIEID